VPSAADFDTAATVADPPHPDRVRTEMAEALRTIANDFAHTFNEQLGERAQADPVAGALAPRYQCGPEHIAELAETLSQALAPLFARLDAGDVDGARRAAIDAWPALERRIQAKWQAYFVLTFQDVSVEVRAERDRRRLQAPRVDIAAVEAMASTQAARLSLSDLSAPRAWDDGPRRNSLLPWLALLVLLVAAIAGGWLLTRGLSAKPRPAGSGGPH
jgi:hypothetical protein